jgi:hypothetical protein
MRRKQREHVISGWLRHSLIMKGSKMHYKDGTPVLLGDIAQHDNGSAGIIIGGTIGSDYCTTHFVAFRKHAEYGALPGYVGSLRGSDGKVISHASVAVALDGSAQTREMVKIGHVDIGHG